MQKSLQIKIDKRRKMNCSLRREFYSLILVSRFTSEKKINSIKTTVPFIKYSISSICGTVKKIEPQKLNQQATLIEGIL